MWAKYQYILLGAGPPNMFLQENGVFNFGFALWKKKEKNKHGPNFKTT